MDPFAVLGLREPYHPFRTEPQCYEGRAFGPRSVQYLAVEEDDAGALAALLDREPWLVQSRGTNGNDLLGMAGSLELMRLLLGRGADPARANDKGWTPLHQAAYGNRVGAARLLLEAGAPHGSGAGSWAAFGCHPKLASELRAAA